MTSKRAVGAAEAVLNRFAPRKRKNLYDVLAKLQSEGGSVVGTKVTKSTWRSPQCYWLLSDATVTPNLFVNRGKAYGVLHWKGNPVMENPRRVKGDNKRVWKLFKESE